LCCTGKERQQEASKAAAASRAATAAEQAAAAATAELEALRCKLSAAEKDQAAARAAAAKQAKLAAKQERLCYQLQQELEARQLDLAAARKQLVATHQELLTVKRQAAAALQDLDGVREEVAAWSLLGQLQSKGQVVGQSGSPDSRGSVREAEGEHGMFLDVRAALDQEVQQDNGAAQGLGLRANSGEDLMLGQQEQQQWQKGVISPGRNNYQQLEQQQQQAGSLSGEELLQHLVWLKAEGSITEGVAEDPNSSWKGGVFQKAAGTTASRLCTGLREEIPHHQNSSLGEAVGGASGEAFDSGRACQLSRRSVGKALGKCLNLKRSPGRAATAAAAAGGGAVGAKVGVEETGFTGAGVEAAWEVEHALVLKEEQLMEAKAEMARLQVRRCGGLMQGNGGEQTGAVTMSCLETGPGCLSILKNLGEGEWGLLIT
jgi:hypothetical protein